MDEEKEPKATEGSKYESEAEQKLRADAAAEDPTNEAEVDALLEEEVERLAEADESGEGSSVEEAPPAEEVTGEDGSQDSAVVGTPADRADFSSTIRRILDIQLPVTVTFGSTTQKLSDIIKLAPGALLELDKSANEPVMLKVNNKAFAWGRVVDVDGYYGVEITEIVDQLDRIHSLGGAE